MKGGGCIVLAGLAEFSKGGSESFALSSPDADCCTAFHLNQLFGAQDPAANWPEARCGKHVPTMTIPFLNSPRSTREFDLSADFERKVDGRIDHSAVVQVELRVKDKSLNGRKAGRTYGSPLRQYVSVQMPCARILSQ